MNWVEEKKYCFKSPLQAAKAQTYFSQGKKITETHKKDTQTQEIMKLFYLFGKNLVFLAIPTSLLLDLY